MSRGLSREQSQIVKGISMLLLLIHHLFNENYEYKTILISQSRNYMDNLVSLSKVCVILFLIISGYGLSKQYEKKEKHTLKYAVSFSINHVIKLYLSYWFIYLLFVPVGIFVGRPMSSVYGGLKDFLLDFFALSYIFETPMANRTWWYISIQMIYYILFPVVYYIVKRWKKQHIYIYIDGSLCMEFCGKKTVVYLFYSVLFWNFISRVGFFWKSR